MKRSIIIISVICIIAIGFSISCSSKYVPPESKKTSGDSDTSGSEGEGSATHSKEIELAANITPEIQKEAHEIVPSYPNSTLDTTKGTYSKTGRGNKYNIVYATTDSVETVAEFFRANIPSEYLKEVKATEDEPKKWIHLTYQSASFPQMATIFIRTTPDDKTEIIYAIDVPSTQAQQEKSQGS